MSKILLTGASGFLGRHLALGLPANITSLGRGETNDVVCDLSKDVPEVSAVDIVVHAAGKAHLVIKTESEEQEFYNVNSRGTQNLLEALSLNPPQHFVFISTVAVYGCENGKLISETHPLEGSTPYAVSKINAEGMVRDWGEKYDVPCLILRLPLIAGPNPPGNLGKMIAGIRKGRYPSIGGGQARRSVVLAEDVAYCIQNNFQKSGTFNLTDGYHPSFREIERCIVTQLGKPMPRRIPLGLARLMGRVGDLLPGASLSSAIISKMTQDLTFDDSKARKELQWNPRRVIDHFQIE